VTKRDDGWVRVESEDELRPGLVVQLRPCLWCGVTEINLLGRETELGAEARTIDGGIEEMSRPFVVELSCHIGAADYEHAIRDGRLYRLAPFASDGTETTRTVKSPRAKVTTEWR